MSSYVVELFYIKEIKQLRETYQVQLPHLEVQFPLLMPIIKKWWDQGWVVVIFKE